jgi:hypothetical protein
VRFRIATSSRSIRTRRDRDNKGGESESLVPIYIDRTEGLRYKKRAKSVDHKAVGLEPLEEGELSQRPKWGQVWDKNAFRR